MTKTYILRFTKAKLIFPEKFTKVRLEDLMSIIYDKKKFLTKKEIEKIENFVDRIMGRRNSYFEYIAKRQGKIIKFIPIN